MDVCLPKGFSWAYYKTGIVNNLGMKAHMLMTQPRCTISMEKKLSLPPPPATGPVFHLINIYFHSDSGELLTHNPNFGGNAAQHVQLKKKKKEKWEENGMNISIDFYVQ